MPYHWHILKQSRVNGVSTIIRHTHGAYSGAHEHEGMIGYATTERAILRKRYEYDIRVKKQQNPR